MSIPKETLLNRLSSVFSCNSVLQLTLTTVVVVFA